MTANERRINNAPRTLNDLADSSRWMAWRQEQRANGKPTKVPYDPNSRRKGSSTNPTTWGTRDQAERRAQRLGQPVGVGIVLGDLGSGFDLVGLDLDGCVIDDNRSLKLTSWANEVLDRFDSYAEISPSGNGVHILCLLHSDDRDAVDQIFRPDGTMGKTFNIGNHCEIAVYRAARYLAVTDDHLSEFTQFRIVDVSDIRWLIQQAGPRFVQRHGDTADNNADRDRHGRDQSDSGFGFRFFEVCKALGMSYENARTAILADRKQPGEWARKYADEADQRQFKPAWQKATARMHDDIGPPLPPTITAHELKDREFPALRFLVPDLIPDSGVVLFAGKPKIGKSFLLLQVGNAIGEGSPTLGGLRCEAADVLYCALEDNERRLQWRLDKLNLRCWSKHLEFLCELPRLKEGGLQVIECWLDTKARSSRRQQVVIIDTLTKVRATANKDQGSQFQAHYEALADLQTLALKRQIVIVVVTHLRKQDADDPFDTISGTLGLNAAADTLLLLRRDGHGGYLLNGRGRDIAEIEKALSYDRQTCVWRILGDADDVRIRQGRAAILKAMRAIAKNQAASPSEIAEEAGLKSGNVKKMLRRMTEDGLIYCWRRGHYCLEPESSRP